MHIGTLVSPLAQCAGEQWTQRRRYITGGCQLRIQLGIAILLPVQIAPGLQQCLSMRVGKYNLPVNIKGYHGVAHAAQHAG
ncbi:hypothetical protein D3C71_1771490 [compost metagenome]